MKRKPGSKFLLGLLLFSFCLTGLMARDEQSINSRSNTQEKKRQQMLKMQTERKLRWELRQMEREWAELQGTDQSLGSKVEMERRGKIHKLQAVQRLQTGKRIAARDEREINIEAKIREIRAARKAIADKGPKTARNGTQGKPIITTDTGAISGRVTNASGVGIQDVGVSVWPLGGNYLGTAFTDASGDYIVSGIPVRTCQVYFWPVNQNYLSEWYDNKSSWLTADLIGVDAGSTTPNINAQLATGGQISGKVTNTSGVGIQGINVCAYDSYGYSVESGTTDASGNYTIIGIETENYKVEFSDYAGNYLAEWYNDKIDFDAADWVSVTAGSTTPNISAQLAVAGCISGRVTNTSATGIDSISVEVYDLNGNDVADGYTDTSGNYTALGLPTGNFKVYFHNYGNYENYISEWYNDKADLNTADQVAVTAGSTTPNINAQLAVGGGISGRVTDASTAGIFYLEVHVYSLANNDLGYTHTDESGNYTFPGLPSGSYKVYFYDLYDYVSEWYNDKGNFDAADQVAVTTGSTTPNINAQLAAAGGISGRVTAYSPYGPGIQNIRVRAYELDHNSLGSVYTDAGGDYYFLGLPAGNIKVFFDNNGQNYASEWYNDKTDFDTADQVAVTAGSTTDNIDAWLEAAADSITVTSPNGGESWIVGTAHTITWTSTGPIANVNIDYSTNSGGNWTSVAAATANDCSYDWTVPSTPSTTCLVRVRDAVDNDPSDSSNAVFTIVFLAESVSAPNQPAGANMGQKAASYPFTTGGSTSNLGHTLQYKFDWDDGSDSGWLASGTTSASHSWSANDTYDVRAMARCVTHTTIESLWSDIHAITISDSGTLGKYNSPSQQKILPEVIWAAATGGGTWMSEVQVTDLSGGSQVAVYYSNAAGRRGPFLLWNNSGGALRSQKYSNMLQTIDGLDSGAFTYYGTVGAVEFVTQDAAHVLQVMARTLNGDYSKTFPALSLHDSNTADTSRVMVIPNLTNNSTYRSTCGMYNPTAAALTVELRLRNAVNTQIGTTISKTVSAYGFSAFSPFSEAGVPYPANAYDNVILQIQPTSGTGKVLCFGASANNATNDPAAHLAVQSGSAHDNGPSDLQILPEAIWAPATGGGTWMSETQVVDVTGGSTVSAWFDYGNGSRRGPFVLWTGSSAGSKVKYANILQQMATIDSGLTYYGRVGTVKFQTQDGAHNIQVTARTLNGNYSKTFPGLNVVDAETADTSRVMLIQNYTNNITYRSTCGFFNPTADAITVKFTLFNGSAIQIGTPFSKTFVGYDFQAFSPFGESGVPYPANAYDNVILKVRPTSGSGKVVCFGASANNASNDPAAHLAVQGQ